MSMVLVESSHTLPLVSMSMYARAGTAHESAAQSGITRVATRMFRRGTRSLSSSAIDERLDELGAELSVEVSTEASALHMTVLRRNLDEAVSLLETLLSESHFPEDEVARLVRETTAEIGDARDSDRHLAHRSFRKALFGDHPYSRRSAGRVSTLATFHSAEVKQYADTHFVAGNALFGFSGDISKEVAERVAARLCAARPTQSAPPSGLAAPTQREGRHLVFVDKPERTQTQLMIGRLGTESHDADHTALSVANTIFGGTFTARLMREVRSKRGWSYGAGSTLSLDRLRHEFVISTSPAAKDAAPCLALELKLLESWVGEGIKDSELKFSKGYLARSYAFERDTASKRLGQKMDEALLDLPAGYHDSYLARVAAVTSEQANAALKARLSPADLVIVVVGTHKELGAAIRDASGVLASETVVAYTDVE